MRRTLLLLLAFACLTPPAHGHVGSHTVVVQDNSFEPERLEIDPGETVTWSARHGGHTVRADNSAFSFSLAQGQSITRTFDSAGLVFYHCEIHGSAGDGSSIGTGMAGVIVVGPAVEIGDLTVIEGDEPHTAQLPVSLTRAADVPVSLDYVTVDGTALAGQDYEATAGTLVLPAGTTTASIPLRIAGDRDREPTEAFSLLLTNVSGAALVRATARVTLANDDDSDRFVPTDAYPTLSSAMIGIRPDTVVHVTEELSLRDSITVDTDRITIIGEGSAAGLTGGNAAVPGIVVRAHDVRIEKLRITGFASGIELVGATRYTIRDITLLPRQRYGIRSIASTAGSIESVVVKHASRAGILIEDCDPCDTVVSSVDVENSFIGFEASRATGIVLRGSTFRDNWNGIALRSRAQAERPLQRGAHIVGNTITGSGVTSASRTTDYATRAQRGDLVLGVGIWVAGGWHNVIEGNHIAGGLHGVVVAGFGIPSNDITVRGNQVVDTGVALGWDGVGAGVCFERNEAAVDRTSPPAIETLYPCHGPGLGVPNGVLLTDLIVNGSR